MTLAEFLCFVAAESRLWAAQAGFDAAAYLTGWGDWRLPGILPLRPSVADSVLGAGATSSERVSHILPCMPTSSIADCAPRAWLTA